MRWFLDKYQVYLLPVIIILCLLGAKPVGASDQIRNLDTEHFTGTLFFTPEQRSPSRTAQYEQTSGNSTRSNKRQSAKPVTVVVSFDGLLRHGGESKAWVNGRPLKLQSLPGSIQQLRVDLRHRQLIVDATSDAQHRLAIGDCLWSDNRVGPCASAVNLTPTVSEIRRSFRTRPLP